MSAPVRTGCRLPLCGDVQHLPARRQGVYKVLDLAPALQQSGLIHETRP